MGWTMCPRPDRCEVVRASLVGAGSAPREAGAMMLISRTSTGRPSAAARWNSSRQRPIAAPDAPCRKASRRARPGQCCGGQVRVLLERFGAAEDATLAALEACRVVAHPLSGDDPLTDGGDAAPGRDGDVFLAPVVLPGRPVFLYGAGHVGRALAPHLVALRFDLHWVDIAEDRFPDTVPAGARRVVATDPTVIAAHAPGDAFHLVITHNHALDEAICHRVLSGGGFARLGLIGSATKAARFRSRLGKAGVDEAALDRLVCPVGLPEITGKHPARVALSIAAGTAVWQQELDETADAGKLAPTAFPRGTR